MRKRGLKDVKRRNRQVVMDAVLEAGNLSRVEIAQRTGLAASTVSALAGELLAEGVLTEAGTVITAGRSRTELSVNPAYGTIAVAEIGRKEVRMTCYDMMLRPLCAKVLSQHYVSGNELLTMLTDCLSSIRRELPALAGIGLLFQEDMRESDFRVVYSTGHDSDSITLRDALRTQFRLPVEEEYSVVYTVSNALSGETDPEVRNSAHISVGSRVRANVTLDGRGLPLRDNFCEELVAAFDQPAAAEGAGFGAAVADTLARLIVMLCMIFPLETVFLSGPALAADSVMADIFRLTGTRLSAGRMPKLKLLKPESMEEGKFLMARQVQKSILTAR